MNKKENQRMRLTKLLFKNALITLLQKKTIYQISVTALCDAAELNRSTFYNYYENVRDILVELEKETLQKSKQCMLLNNSANDDFPAEIMQETIEFLKDKANSLDIREKEKSDYLFQYLVSGCISVIQNWINGEMKESPMEISELIYHTSVAVLDSVKH